VSVLQPLAQVDMFVKQTLRSVRVHIDGDGSPVNRVGIVHFGVLFGRWNLGFGFLGHATVTGEQRKQN
jgi:hypothetical protein